MCAVQRGAHLDITCTSSTLVTLGSIVDCSKRISHKREHNRLLSLVSRAFQTTSCRKLSLIHSIILTFSRPLNMVVDITRTLALTLARAKACLKPLFYFDSASPPPPPCPSTHRRISISIDKKQILRFKQSEHTSSEVMNQKATVCDQDGLGDTACVGQGTVTALQLLEGAREVQQEVQLTAAPALWDADGVMMSVGDPRQSNHVVCPSVLSF